MTPGDHQFNSQVWFVATPRWVLGMPRVNVIEHKLLNNKELFVFMFHGWDENNRGIPKCDESSAKTSVINYSQ